MQHETESARGISVAKNPVDQIYSQGRNGAPVVLVKIKPPKWELDDAPAPNDGEVARNWLRGYGSPHPYFDRSNPTSTCAPVIKRP
jgi:hypothetical protein